MKESGKPSNTIKLGQYILAIMAGVIVGLWSRGEAFLVEYFMNRGQHAHWLVLLIVVLGFLFSLVIRNAFKERTQPVSLALLVAACASSVPLIFWLKEWTSMVDVVILLTPLFVGLLLGLSMHTTRQQLVAILAATMLFMVGFSIRDVKIIWTLVGFIASVMLIYTVVLRKNGFKHFVVPGFALFAVISITVISVRQIPLFDDQPHYNDKIVYEYQNDYNKLVVTRWKRDYFIFLNGNKLLSTIDYSLIYEPMVYLGMPQSGSVANVLVVGGENGLMVDELQKQPGVQNIWYMPIDSSLARVFRFDLDFAPFNLFKSEKLLPSSTNNLDTTSLVFDMIFCDLPVPSTKEAAEYYSYEYYLVLKKRLKPGGVLVSNASDPFRAPLTTKCIRATLDSVGFDTRLMYNKTLTSGAWSWVVASDSLISDNGIKIPDRTDWLTEGAQTALTSFGKDAIPTEKVAINTKADTRLLYYYKIESGNF